MTIKPSSFTPARLKRWGPWSSIRAGVLLAAVLSACAGPTEARVSGMRGAGLHLTGGAGPADFDSSTGNDTSFDGDVDESDTAITLGGGYRFNEYASVELGWVDLGDVAYKGQYSGTPADGTVGASGFQFAARGHYPINDMFEGVILAGLYWWDAEDSGLFAGVPFSEDNDGVDLVYGLGVQASITPQIAARIEYRSYQDVWDTDPRAFFLEVLFGF